MIFNDVIIGTTSSNLVHINEYELSARLGNGVDLHDINLSKYMSLFNENVQYRYAYVCIPLKIERDICLFEGETVKSAALSKVLKNANKVILLSVTAGIEIDKLISKACIQNSASAFYIDAIASAGIESYIEYITDSISEGLNTTNRFSPGYADFPLEFQAFLLNRLNAERIGIKLSKDYFMIPTKSITAVIGIK